MIKTERYEWAHGHKPRGRGNWLFEDQMGGIEFEHRGTFSEAKKLAEKRARELSIPLHVSP